ncbi:MAG: CaiB/BaiF CoA transferase family protein [Dehalococcoidia bacterium]
MSTPLEGIRVVDWTILQQGPVAASMLGDLGAEVIKIEQRVTGDPARGFTNIMGLPATALAKRNFYFETNNRNKKGMTLDLKKERAREVVYRLVEKSDVFVQNFRKGVAERLGLGYETLSRYNPKLIYATASGYGPEGPESTRPSIDPAGLARAGMMEVLAPLGMPPQYPPGGLADQMGAVMLAYGVLAALVARERQGVGQRVDASHIASVMWLESMAVHQYLITGKEAPKWNRQRSGNPLHNAYRCADGKWLFMGLLQPDRYWPQFCQALGISELEQDPPFATTENRRDHREELIAILDERFATRTSSEWFSHLSNFPDLIFEVVSGIPDLPHDPQVIANDYIVEVEHPTEGPTKMLGVPVKFSQTPGRVGLVPEFGQHTEEVLLDICGYSWEEIAELKEQEVI